MRYNHSGVIGEIDNLPGCSQVAVFHSVFVREQDRGKGIGRSAHAFRLQEAKDLGYNLVMCTVNEKNIAEIKILKEYGWKEATSFDSTKTGNSVLLFTKHI